MSDSKYQSSLIDLVAMSVRHSHIPLVLHACCGPCSLMPVRMLQEEGFAPTLLWTNDNIAPQSEHDLRRDTLVAWARDVAGIPFVELAYESAAWEQRVAPLGFAPTRCSACYQERLHKACLWARDHGFSYIATTLAVSPYQQFEACRDMLYRNAERMNLIPVWRDWREYYPEATTRSRELQMYRQNYCGCRFSAAEAALERITHLSSSTSE